MKFKVNGKDFHALRSHLLNGDTNSNNKYLAMRIKDDKLEMVLYTNVTYFKGNIPIEDSDGVDEEWRCLNPEELKTTLSVPYSDVENITFEEIDNDKFNIKFGKNKINLNTIENYPVQVLEDYSKIADIDSLYLKTTLQNVNNVVETDSNNSGGPMSSLHFFINNEDITLMGSDRISIVEIKIENTNNETDEILIEKSYVDMLKKINTTYPTIQIVKTDNKFGLVTNNNFISLVGISDENAINYKGLKGLVAKPNDKDYNEIIIDRKSLSRALSNVKKISRDDPSVRLFISKNGLKIKNKSGDEFELITEQNPDIETNFGLNIKSLNSLIPIFTDKIKMIFKDNSIASVIEFKMLEIDENNENYIETNNTFIGIASDDE